MRTLSLMMRQGLFLFLLIVLNTGPAYAEWVWISSAQSDGGYDVYVDRSTIRRKGDVVRIRVLYDYKTIHLSSGFPYLSNRTELQSNCAAALQRRIEVIWFSDHMAEGSEVFTASLESKWSPIPPRSIAQSLFRVACSKT